MKNKIKDAQIKCTEIANTIDSILLLLDSDILSQEDKLKLLEIGETQATGGIFYFDTIKQLFKDEQEILLKNEN